MSNTKFKKIIQKIMTSWLRSCSRNFLFSSLCGTISRARIEGEFVAADRSLHARRTANINVNKANPMARLRASPLEPRRVMACAGTGPDIWEQAASQKPPALKENQILRTLDGVAPRGQTGGAIFLCHPAETSQRQRPRDLMKRRESTARNSCRHRAPQNENDY